MTKRKKRQKTDVVQALGIVQRAGALQEPLGDIIADAIDEIEALRTEVADLREFIQTVKERVEQAKAK